MFFSPKTSYKLDTEREARQAGRVLSLRIDEHILLTVVGICDHILLTVPGICDHILLTVSERNEHILLTACSRNMQSHTLLQ